MNDESYLYYCLTICFIIDYYRMFEPISLKINNLGDDASRHDGSDYKPTPVRKSTRTPDSFTKLIESLK